MKTRTRTGVALLIGLAFAAGATPAFATEVEDGAGMLDGAVATNETAASRQTCTDPELSTPLLAFKDARSYFTAPGGDFQSGTAQGWRFSGGAKIAAGSHSFTSLGLVNQYALSLPAGAVATSPEFCVDLNYPTFRFMMAQVAKDGDGKLAVDVIYPDLEMKNAREAKKLSSDHSDGWALSRDVELEPKRAGKEAGWRHVALRFRSTAKPDDSSEYRIDNLLIDPRCRG